MREGLASGRGPGTHPDTRLVRGSTLILVLPVNPGVDDVAVVLAEDAAHPADRLDAGSGEVAFADRLVPIVMGRVDGASINGAVRDRERAALVRIIDPDMPVDKAVADHDAGG